MLGKGGKSRATFERARVLRPLHVHGVSLNIGGPDPLRMDHVDALGRMLDAIGADELSEHLCFVAAFGSCEPLQKPFKVWAMKL